MGSSTANSAITESDSDASSLPAASIAVGPSPPICAETSTKWMLCG
jgi:hypothetical protein